MENNVFSSSDILLVLCDSVSRVMTSATKTEVKFAPIVQKISQTVLRPEIGTFVLFTGSFSGMVVMNFPKEAAMEIYRNYMLAVGLPREEVASNYTSDSVSNSLGELMNQILGDFTSKISHKLHTTITQSQPKMLTLPQEVQININVNLDHPKYYKMTFFTKDGNEFYMEYAMDDTEFTMLKEIVDEDELNPDEILAQMQGE
ncbi:MAG: DUF3334 family protein [Succinivibrionaceae bacterium]|nr:DUF3334 family protein [Succinivibrionaceae bacterium]